ncbi:MAG TPA: hypothetical protein V6D14_19935 [Coleofasciculaceae cyanobacterium]|jgi:hypothetical protein
MSESDTRQNYEPVTVNPAEEAVQNNQVSYPVQPMKPSLLEEVRRGWKWVIFIWKLLPRLGGFTKIVQSLFLLVSVLIRRLLRQLGININKQ